MGGYDPGLIEFASVKRKPVRLAWEPTWYYGAATGVMLVCCLVFLWELASNPPFIYFNF
jgi:hypothetical protein